MRRVWFMKEMRDAILARKKTATTRYHPLKLESYQAVCGSRFNAVPFAILKIESRIPTTWGNVVLQFYREEGFDTPGDMIRFGKAHRSIHDNPDDKVFYHVFSVTEVNM